MYPPLYEREMLRCPVFYAFGNMGFCSLIRYSPNRFHSCAATPTSELTTEQREMLQLGTALRNIGWLAFWSQLILTSVAAVILLFSTGVTTIGSKLSLNAMDICTLVGVGAGLFTTALSWTWIRAGRRLGMLQPIKVQQCLGSVLASVNINLVGMGAAIVGLQATVGTLVAKTLSTAAGGYYGPRMAPPPVAFDVFSVQACSNAIMAHFAGMVLAQWLVRIITRYIAQAEERAMMRPSAPTMPPTFG